MNDRIDPLFFETLEFCPSCGIFRDDPEEPICMNCNHKHEEATTIKGTFPKSMADALRKAHGVL